MNVKDQVLQVLSTYITPILVVGFGSFWNGTPRSDSDIDIAVYASDIILPLEKVKIAQELSHVLNRDVDLIDLRQANTILKEHIIRTGIYLWEKSPSARAEFESTALLESFAFKTEREEIIEHLKEEGSLF